MILFSKSEDQYKPKPHLQHSLTFASLKKKMPSMIYPTTENQLRSVSQLAW